MSLFTDKNIINTIKQFYGTFSIPAWMRIPHKPLQEVENYHSDLDFNDIDNSSLPRVDVLLDPDYKLGKKEYTECCIKITNAGEYITFVIRLNPEKTEFPSAVI